MSDCAPAAGVLLLLLALCLGAVALGLLLAARAGPRVTTALLLLLTFAQVAASAFSPHWLPPERHLLPDAMSAIAAALYSPTTLQRLDCAGWAYERLFALTVTQPLQMAAVFSLIFLPCYRYRMQTKGEGSEWFMGNLSIYLHSYYNYLHVAYMMLIATCLQPFTCRAHHWSDGSAAGVSLHGSLEDACESTVPREQSVRRLLQAVSLILLFVIGIGVPLGSTLFLSVPPVRRRLQEHSRLQQHSPQQEGSVRENVETKPGYYLVRDQRWSRFTICRQFKAGSTGVDRRGRAKVAAGTELPFSFERFWLTVEMLWKLSLLLLPLAVSDEDHALKFVPGAVSTAIMLLCQLSFNPYISTRQNRCAALLYSFLLVLYILACIFHGLDQGTGGQKTVRGLAAAFAGIGGVGFFFNLLHEMHRWRTYHIDDGHAHELEEQFKKELKGIFESSGADKEKVSGKPKIYDAEELVDLEMAKLLKGVFDRYKMCFREVVAELAADAKGEFEMPPEPHVETESWRRVASQPELRELILYSAQSSTAFDDKTAATLVTEAAELESQRLALEGQLAETSNEKLTEAAKLQAQLDALEDRISDGMGKWAKDVDSWVVWKIAESLARYVLEELKKEKVGGGEGEGGGDFKYKCLHSRSKDRAKLIDRKFLAYLHSKTSRYLIALQTSCRSKASEGGAKLQVTEP